MRSLVLVLLVLGIGVPAVASAQPLLYENFGYPAGDSLGAHGWVCHSGGATNRIMVTAPGLSYTGYPSPGMGNATSLTTTGQDTHKMFTAQTTGSVYYAFLTTVSAANTVGDYFIHLGLSPWGTDFYGRVYCKRDVSNNLAFGAAKQTETGITYTGFNYALNTTYLIVVRYTFNTGTTTDDVVSVWINPVPCSTEPTPLLNFTATSADVAAALGGVALRQGATAAAPTLRVDGIRVGLTWSDVTCGTYGTDTFPDSRATVEIEGPEGRYGVTLDGPTTVNLGDLADADGDDLEEIQTEMVQLDLVGSNSVYGAVELTLRSPAQHPYQRTVGEIEETQNTLSGRLDLPPYASSGSANSFFDVFFEVRIPAFGLVLHNEDPKRMESVLLQIPPGEGEQYEKPLSIALFDEDDQPTPYWLSAAHHIPDPEPEPDGGGGKFICLFATLYTPWTHGSLSGHDGFYDFRGTSDAAPRPNDVRADTLDFGYYELRGGVPYAVRDGEWTWDHGAADPLEGWTSRDMTDNDGAYWRALTAAKWAAEGASIGWPQMTGAGMVLCGATKGHADSLGWVNGIGYGNKWCQRLTSPELTYDGSGTVGLSLEYFSESEVSEDHTKIFVESGAGLVQINTPGFSGKLGIDALGVLTPVSYLRTISNDELGGGTDPRTFRIVIEFLSDAVLSDEDRGGNSFYGGVGMDNITLTGNLVSGNVAYDFDDGTLQGWTATKCPGVGSFLGVADLNDYTLVDPCACALTGNVIEMHDSGGTHPDGQHETVSSPIVDRENDIPGNYLSYNRIFAEWDHYADLPAENGVFYRSGWSYYPYENLHVPGMFQWSPRVGIGTWYYTGDMPMCERTGNIGTDWGLPGDAKQIKFIYEIYASGEAFGVTLVSGPTNFTPLLDNIRIRNVGTVAAPVARFEPGTQFTDGFGQSLTGLLSTTDPGNANVVSDGSQRRWWIPTALGPVLVVTGPEPSSPSTKWEAKLWFRLRRSGPGQTNPSNPGWVKFNQWKTVVGPNVDYPNFAWGYMDSVEARDASSSRFCSRFREDDPKFNWGGGGDQGEGNDILPDGVFTPGTKIEYFVTTNYISTPATYYVYPDTVGRVYNEFEILPSFRTVGGVDKFPCVLYVDASNAGAQVYIENALNVVLNGALLGDPIPDPTAWDRYDYLDASSNWNGPLYRMTGGNSGATIPQLLGYKLIMVSTGDASTGTMEPRDWQGFQQWLDAGACDGNANLQGFIVDGTSAAKVMNTDCPYLLNNTLGTTYTCRAYSEQGCAPGETQDDQQNCVRVEPTVYSPFAPGIATDVFGNWCPAKVPFNVLGTTGTGVGNKTFEKINSGPPAYQTSFAQVINDNTGPGGPNRRSVIESFSYHRLVKPDPGNLGLGECVYADPAAGFTAQVEAACKEIENAIKWTLNISDPLTLGYCVNPCTSLTDVPDEEGAGALVTRLYQNRPNPFNPRTAIKFSLAADGPAKLIIYDVNGRRIRTLVDGGLKAGMHQVVWDGSDDAGHAVSSGVYWSQLHAGTYSSNKKMVVLK